MNAEISFNDLAQIIVAGDRDRPVLHLESTDGPVYPDGRQQEAVAN